jgi:hypothetical protein
MPMARTSMSTRPTILWWFFSIAASASRLAYERSTTEKGCIPCGKMREGCEY